MISEQYIKETFPEIEEIADEKLKAGVVNIWAIAAEKGGWDDLNVLPFSLLLKDRTLTLVDHTRKVTRMAMAVTRERDDLDMDLEDDSKLEAEYARLGMPGGVADFSFSALFDQAACIQCGRCNDACPAGPVLKPRDHFVVALQNPSLTGEELATLIDAETEAEFDAAQKRISDRQTAATELEAAREGRAPASTIKAS